MLSSLGLLALASVSSLKAFLEWKLPPGGKRGGRALRHAAFQMRSRVL